ncbi:hypothetical protein TNCT_460191 [Trichonephila clavata]|uniref:Uncharacterized protein n=1 Tax=Trichonephila clavata TaxID=2740835 RepID=A0A8X6LDW8_TRICU|nr:hypothetical protein TNCT_460191 [Trichonephila clavata]
MTRPYLDTLGKTLLESLGSERTSLEIEEIELVNGIIIKDHRGFPLTGFPRDRLVEWVVTLLQFESSSTVLILSSFQGISRMTLAKGQCILFLLSSPMRTISPSHNSDNGPFLFLSEFVDLNAFF